MSSAFAAQKAVVPGAAAVAVVTLALGLGMQFGISLIAGVAVFVTVFLLVQDTKAAVTNDFDMLAEEERVAAERTAKKQAREAAAKEKEAKRLEELKAADAAKAEREAAKKAAKKAATEAAILKSITPAAPVRAPEPVVDTSKMSKAQLKKYKKDQAQREEEERQRQEEERQRLEEMAKKLAAEQEAKKAAKKAKKLGPAAEAALAKKKKEEEAAKFAALLKSGAVQEDSEEGWTSVVAPTSSKKSSSAAAANGAETAASVSASSKKGGKAAAAAAAEGAVYVPETVVQLPIEEKQRSLLMGAKGATLMLLEEGTGAQIEVPKKDNKLGQVRLIGTAEAVHKAKTAIESLLNLGYSSITNPGFVHEDLIVEPKNYGTIIGSQGAYLNAIQNKTETRIRVPNAGSKVSEPVRVVGLKDNVLLACLAIKELIADGYSPLTHEGYERREVAFPREKLPFLIGPKGQTIRSIEKNTKTRINVSEVSHPGYVVVVGPPAGIEAAQRELARLLIPPEVVQEAPEEEYVNGTWAPTNFTEDELW